MTYWNQLSEWMLSFGHTYGVNPFIFSLLYFGTIPLSLIAFSVLIRNYRSGKSIFWPFLLMFLSYIGTYIYLFWVGKNIPYWVYGLILGGMGYSGVLLFRKMKNLFLYQEKE